MISFRLAWQIENSIKRLYFVDVIHGRLLPTLMQHFQQEKDNVLQHHYFFGLDYIHEIFNWSFTKFKTRIYCSFRFPDELLLQDI